MPEISSMDQQFMEKLINAIDKHLSDDKFGVAELAAELGMSRVTLHRKVKSIVKKSVSEFIRETRLKRSFDQLRNRTGTVSEIAYQVGFSSPAYFSKSFHDFYGLPPGEVLKGNYPKHLLKKKETITITSSKKTIYRIVAGFSLVIILVASYFIFKPDKPTIAILPATDINSENGTNSELAVLREYLHDDMDKIRNLKVITSLATDKYRSAQITPKEIGKEIGAGIILKLKNLSLSNNQQEIITVLIDSKTEKQIKSFRDTIKLDDENLDQLSSQITLNTANALNIPVKSEEELGIKEKISESAAARRHYESAIDLAGYAKHNKFSNEWDKAINEFWQVVKIDSTCGDAWLKLAEIYSYQKLMPNRYVTEFLALKTFNTRLDSIRLMLNNAEKYGRANKVLTLFLNSIDNKEKYEDTELARKPMKIPEYYRAAGILAYLKEDYYNAIKNWFKFKESVPNLELWEISNLHTFIAVTGTSGFYNESEKLAKLALENTGDTTYYRYSMIAAITGRGMESFRDTLFKFHQIDTSEVVFVNFLMNVNHFLDNDEVAYQFLQKRVALLQKQNRKVDPNIFMAYLYNTYGNEKEGWWHCQKVLENRIALLDSLALPMPSRIYLQLAAGYAMSGKQDSALLCLEKIAQLETYPSETIGMIKTLPHFDYLRNDIRFQEYLKQTESNFIVGQENIKRLLVQKGWRKEKDETL